MQANSRTVVGVDFGTLNTVIAVARNRGVDVVRIPLGQARGQQRLTCSRSQTKSQIEPHRKSHHEPAKSLTRPR